MPQQAWRTRAERPDDVARVHEINVDAFERSEEAELVDALRADAAWIDGLSVVSVDADDRPVGYALLTRCHIDDTPALGLAPCAVVTAQQRTGAGSAAIIAALDAARVLEESTVVVLGHADYYPRFGFGRAVDHGVRLSIEVPEDALMVLSLDGTDIPSGTVRYAAPFGI
ncbi:GNAT family N-acetyltransferase [Gordonia westfalica]|uniref:Predicted N-acetyltransferase YhbS n=1 Tax=Gordonia westfalica TaxID=158898 RepID=A0A1H2I6Z5_9ACTN|nr:N-acetyltransferase [Gordonia westfalica]SDU39897.1 Predicted N-acetyltransferase YhbS [Gordonia westfalica]